MRQYSTRARIGLREPAPVIAELYEHMLEHNAQVAEEPQGIVLRLADVEARFSHEGGETLVDIDAPDLESLYFARLTVASHILEFAGDEAPSIVWTGDGGEIERPPNFQTMELRGCRDITPHMRRLTFAADDAARFAGLDALHLNLMIQQPGVTAPQWPRVGQSGVMEWPDPSLRPDMRKYTVRSLDVESGLLEIDFVLHDDAGPGSRFAATAAVGERVGVLGPGGGGLVAADWYLFAGDETALPAIARMLEALAPEAQGEVFIEVADAGEIQPVSAPPGMTVRWLARDGAPAGTTDLLPEAVRGTRIPAEGGRYVWAGCEYAAFRAIRSFLRQDVRLAGDEHLVVSYWRRGVAE